MVAVSPTAVLMVAHVAAVTSTVGVVAVDATIDVEMAAGIADSAAGQSECS